MFNRLKNKYFTSWAYQTASWSGALATYDRTQSQPLYPSSAMHVSENETVVVLFVCLACMIVLSSVLIMLLIMRGKSSVMKTLSKGLDFLIIGTRTSILLYIKI